MTNGLLVRAFRLAPVLATLAVYFVLQGVSLLLRPQAAGSYRTDVTSLITATWGWVPVAFVLACALALVAELLLRGSERDHLDNQGVGIRGRVDKAEIGIDRLWRRGQESIHA